MSDLNNIGIVGAGTMGKRIALSCLAHGKGVRLYDSIPSVRSTLLASMHELLEKNAQKLNLTATQVENVLERLTVTSCLKECVVGAGLVIETVPENLELKRQIFRDIGPFLDPNTLVCTNSSSIPGSWLADSVPHSERFFNLNFGSVNEIKVELMGHPGTSSRTLSTANGFLRSLNLVPIQLNGENMGYATNRVWRAVKKEVLSILSRNLLSVEDIDRAWMLEWNTQIGPCGFMDEVGLDIVRDIEMIYFHASGDESDRPPQFLTDMIAEGKLGIKSGEGFYRYPNPAYRRDGWLKG